VKYRAVIFDLFGTLIDNFTHSAHEAVLREMAAALGVSGDAFVRGWLGSYELRNRGAFASTEGNVAYVLGTMGTSAELEAVTRAAGLRREFTRSCLVPREEAVPTLTALKERGLKLGLVSDCAVEVPRLWESTPFAPLFGAAIFSCVVKTKKPDPAIYLMACEGLGVAPQECLYVGDGSSRELSGAAAVGMHPVLIRAPHEQHQDTFRVDQEEWEGEVIASLSEVLGRLH
jgi:putative hydrolase of the HAD superfamily